MVDHAHDRSRLITVLHHDRLRVLLVTFCSYAALHAARKSFSNSKAALQDARPGAFPTSTLAALDTLFMIAYSTGLLLAGRLGDVFSASTVLAIGLGLTTIAQTVFALLCVLRTPPDWEFKVVLFAIWILNGLVQSLCWPACVKLVGNWLAPVHHLIEGSEEEETSADSDTASVADDRVGVVNPAHSGMLFGMWSSNASVGNIVGALMAALALGIAGAHAALKEMGVLLVFLGPSLLMVIFTYYSSKLKDFPPTADDVRARGLQVTTASPSGAQLPTLEAVLAGLKEIWLAFRLPFVARYSVVYACTKGVNYAMFFWLPYYLSEVCKLDPGLADGLSVFYDIGQCLGGVIAGSIVDKCARGKKSIVITSFLVLAIIPTLALSLKYASAVPITMIIFLAGLLV
ncbi:hypothetical protein FOZ63_002897, partial [Perkinsus olseni]